MHSYTGRVAEWTDNNGIKWYFNVSGSNATDIQQNMGWGQLSGDIEIPGTVYDGGTALTVTSIAAFGFMSCSGLTSVTIPSSVTSIGDMAFYECSGLTNVYCHVETPPTITSGVFYTYNATLYVPENSLEAYQSAEVWNGFTHIVPLPINATIDGIKYSLIKTTGEATVIQGNYRELTSVDIPPTISYNGDPYRVTGIGNSAFIYCYELMSATLPEGLTSIGNDAFSYCAYMTSLNIPSTVTTIGERAFYACASLSSVIIPESVTSLAKSVFEKCYGMQSVTIPSTVTSIGESAFSMCTGLTNVNIPEGVTTIANFTFESCSNLANVTIPSTVTSIGGFSFQYCSSLTNVNIPEGVTSIGDLAFYSCTHLTEVNIPSTVTSIGTMVFNNCPDLASVYCSVETPLTINDNVFTNYDATLYVPASSLEAYQSAPVWKKFNISPILAGDVDGDGMVDVADFTVLANYLLGKNPANFHSWAADVAGSSTGGPDGEIDIADLTGVANIILHTNSGAGSPQK